MVTSVSRPTHHTLCWGMEVNYSIEHFYNMSDFLRGQSSKLITGLSDEDKTAFVLKNGKPVAVLISHERYERLLKAGIDITEY